MSIIVSVTAGIVVVVTGTVVVVVVVRGIVVVVGGIIPATDHSFLKSKGVACIFGPGTAIPEAADTVLNAIQVKLK